MLPSRPIYDEDHRLFRDSVRSFLARELHPHKAAWREAGMVPRDFWLKAGAAGLLCPGLPEEYGGPGGDFRHHCVVDEELAYGGLAIGLSVHSDICMPYILKYGSAAQKRRWLPRMVSGEVVAAIAMSEPAAGSDLQGIRTTARRDGDHY
ncbi:MAG: acyl-CoA dehydrogenase family protein, partial [Rhodothalassiaceae bacterium]